MNEEHKPLEENHNPPTIAPLRTARRTIAPLDLSISGKEENIEESKTTETELQNTEADTKAKTEVTKQQNQQDVPASQNTENMEEQEEKTILSAGANLFDWVKSFLFSLTVVIFIFTLIFRGVTVNGTSMLPTLEHEEYLVISDLFYQPKTGDIVVVQSPHYKNGTEPLIKRIIATSEQELKINFTTWQVWVDGKELKEDYILKNALSTMDCEDFIPDENGEVTIKIEKNCIFVMGDNRNNSLDSRSQAVGQIDERFIMGKVVLRVTPLERFGKVD